MAGWKFRTVFSLPIGLTCEHHQELNNSKRHLKTSWIHPHVFPSSHIFNKENHIFLWGKFIAGRVWKIWKSSRSAPGKKAWLLLWPEAKARRHPKTYGKNTTKIDANAPRCCKTSTMGSKDTGFTANLSSTWEETKKCAQEFVCLSLIHCKKYVYSLYSCIGTAKKQWMLQLLNKHRKNK